MKYSTKLCTFMNAYILHEDLFAKKNCTRFINWFDSKSHNVWKIIDQMQAKVKNSTAFFAEFAFAINMFYYYFFK